MEKRTAIIIVLGLFAILAGFIFINDQFLPSKEVQLAPTDFSFVLPNCSAQSVQEFWDIIFVESSSGITVKYREPYLGFEWDKCTSFFAHKVVDDQVFMLALNATPGGDFFSSILGIKANVTQEYIDLLNASQDEVLTISFGTALKINETMLFNRTLVSFSEANDSYYQSFKLPLTEDFSVYAGGELSYFFTDTQEGISGGLENFTGQIIIPANYSYEDFILLSQGFDLGCPQTYVQVNESCQGGSFISWLNNTDLNLSNPCTDYLFTPENITYSCTSETNDGSIIGDIPTFLSDNPEITVYLDSVLLNVSELDFNGIVNVDFKYGNETIVLFDYDFLDKGDFDVDNLGIIKQDTLDSFGYLIVEGVDSSKIFFVDIINRSGQVCVKDTQITSIFEISDNCSSSQETVVDCPGNNNGFSCSILGNSFVVSGLINSGVREFVNTSTIISNDTNGIGDTPAPSCSPDWTCVPWFPEECPKSGEQTRICTDINLCNNDLNKPLEIQSCDYQKDSQSSIIFFSVIIFLVVFTIVIIVFILKAYNKRKFTDKGNVPKITESRRSIKKPVTNIRKAKSNPRKP